MINGSRKPFYANNPALVREEAEAVVPNYEGRLELTWTNKSERLLAHEDGTYEWVPSGDYRVAEVRLLRDRGAVGHVGPERCRAKDNLLVAGDALYAFTSLVELPEFAREYVGRVALAYLDPPFNTRQSFLHYDDALEHSVWLTMMRDRLVRIKVLLAPHGSVWVHCDDSEQAYLKAMMDEVFGREAFVTSFIWRKVDSPNTNTEPLSPDHEYILCYAKTPGKVQFARRPDPSVADAYKAFDEHGRRCRDRLLKKNGKDSLREDRPKMYFSIKGPDGADIYPIHDDGRDARWSAGEKNIQQALAEGKLVWKQRELNGALRWVPYTREYAPDLPSRPWPSIWTDLNTTRQAKAHLTELFPGVTPFATPKPEDLIARILEIGSQPGDIVLDCFVGSGTTAAVAHKMGRRWVASEQSNDTLRTYTIPRLTHVIEGTDLGGITEAVGWPGGGSFRILEVASSMFEADRGVIVLADWAINSKLAEATAAQLGFAYEPSSPFSGRKGRQRLAVVDGLIGVQVAHLLVQQLGEDERLVLCGTAVDPAVRDELRKLRAGSTVRKIPSSILDRYRRAADEVEANINVSDTAATGSLVGGGAP